MPRAQNLEAAARVSGADGARFIAGDANLLDLMKPGIEASARIIDINRPGGNCAVDRPVMVRTFHDPR